MESCLLTDAGSIGKDSSGARRSAKSDCSILGMRRKLSSGGDGS